jgi:predicted dienelactone hydrolase
MWLINILSPAVPAGKCIMRRCLLISMIWLLVVMPAGGSDLKGEAVRLGGMNVVVWSTDVPVPATKPVIIFSHGFHGSATQSRFLMEALAAHGYLVFALNHHDATGRSGESSRLTRPEEPFRKPEGWSDKTYRDRAEDVRNLVAAIKADERFRDQADLQHMGLVGHSLGGYTVMGLGGAWPGWKLDGIRAVLALSPYSQPFLTHQTLGGLTAPVMYQGGTRDFGITPALHKSQGAYDQTPAPKYFVEFQGAGHLAWTDLRSSSHELIIAYSLAFLDHYVKGLPALPALTQTRPGVAALRYDSELGTSGAATGQERARQSLRERLRQRRSGPTPLKSGDGDSLKTF